MKPEEALAQIEIAEKVTVKLSGRKKYLNIVFPGIEKSGLIQAILEDLYPDIPIIVTEYDITAEIHSKSLVIIPSYGGTTPEILSFYKEAQKKTKNILVVTSNQKLLRAAIRNKHIPVKLPADTPASLFLLFFTTLFALSNLSVLKISASELAEAKAVIQGFSSNYKTFQYVEHLKNTVPAIYTWDQFHSVGAVVKHNFNVMAKMYAIHSTLPEADYTDIEALAYGDAHVTPIFIYPGHIENAEKIMKTVEVIASKHSAVLHYHMPGKSPLAQIVSAILFFKVVAVRLAQSRGVDPYSRDAVKEIKEQFNAIYKS